MTKKKKSPGNGKGAATLDSFDDLDAVLRGMLRDIEARGSTVVEYGRSDLDEMADIPGCLVPKELHPPENIDWGPVREWANRPPKPIDYATRPGFGLPPLNPGALRKQDPIEEAIEGAGRARGHAVPAPAAPPQPDLPGYERVAFDPIGHRVPDHPPSAEPVANCDCVRCTRPPRLNRPARK